MLRIEMLLTVTEPFTTDSISGNEISPLPKVVALLVMLAAPPCDSTLHDRLNMPFTRTLGSLGACRFMGMGTITHD